MTDLTRWRLLLDDAASGAWNMAVDEVLLESSAAGGGCFLRFYRWQEPTLSLGYFQPYDDRRDHAASRDCPVVRRISGGGAILHDVELTYSMVVPAAHLLAIRHLLLYETVHAALIDVLAEMGVEATLCRQSDRVTARKQPFFCFQRRARGDVLVDGTKIAGSAQRRRRGAVLQHGSLLIARSVAAPELAGLSDLTGEPVLHERLTAAWLEKLIRRLPMLSCSRSGPLSAGQKCRVAELVESKYASSRWTENRGRQKIAF